MFKPSVVRSTLLLAFAALPFACAGSSELALASDDDETFLPTNEEESIGGALSNGRFSAIADAEVQGASPSKNYGTSTQIASDGNPVRHAYLRFEVSGITDVVTKAVLRCFVINASGDGPAVYKTSNTWSETGLTYSNRPAPSGSALADSKSVALNKWLELDVTAAVKGNGTYSFVLIPTSSDSVICNSREATTNRPELVLTLAPPVVVDSGTVVVDAGKPVVDAGTPVIDSGTVVVDAGRPVVDSGTPVVADAGSAPAGIPAVGGLSAPAGYNLKWADEFNGSAVDASKWNMFDNSNYGSGNNEDQCFFARNASVSNGTLKLTAKRETVTCGSKNPDGPDNTYFFTSAFLTTRAQSGSLKMKFRYGYVEASIKHPKGNPFWSGFWLVGPGDGSTPGWPDYGEFDISEILPIRPDITHGTLWYTSTSGSATQTASNVYNLVTKSASSSSSNQGTLQTAANFATYDGPTTSRFIRLGFLWEPNRVVWYVDGVAVRSFDGNKLIRYDAAGNATVEKTVGVDLPQPKTDWATFFAYEHSIHLNLSVGGAFAKYEGYTGGENGSGGYNDGNLIANLPGSMEVDYVRVFQKP